MKMPTMIAYECLDGDVPEFINDFVIKVAEEVAVDNAQSLICAVVSNENLGIMLRIDMWPKCTKKIALSFEMITDSAIDLPKMIKAKCEAMPDLKMTRCIDAKEGKL